MINIFVCLSKLSIIDKGDKKIKKVLASIKFKDVAYFLTKFFVNFFPLQIELKHFIRLFFVMKYVVSCWNF